MANTPEADRVQRPSTISTQREPKVYTLEIHIAVGSSLELVYRDDQDPDTVARDWLGIHGYSHVQDAREGIAREIRQRTGGQVIEDSVQTTMLSTAQAHVPHNPLELNSVAKWPKYDQIDTFAIPGQIPAVVKSEVTSHERIAKLVKEDSR
ncbi:hypothetical protein LTS10_009296 [Elasticomyces elasticus]|nr:hypothetical protein LTS10_009296 [Elasticomyces elasticus]